MQSNADDQERIDLAAGPDRRTFLQMGALATGALGWSGQLAAHDRRSSSRRTPKVTVVVFQRGGADHLNLYAPTGDPNYALWRPTIGIRPPGSPSGVVGLAMNATFSMHPAMSQVMEALR